MTLTRSCEHEAEVLDLVWMSQWTARADRTLIEHVAGCEICRDLATVAQAVGDLNDVTTSDAKVPDAGLVWYRAEIRARQERARRATRPVAAAQVAAAVFGVASLFAAWRLIGTSFLAWWQDLSTPSLPSVGFWSELVALTATPMWTWMLAAVAAWALMIPAALYIARMADRVGGPTQDRP